MDKKGLKKRSSLVLGLAGILILFITSPSCNRPSAAKAAVSADTSLMLCLNGVEQYIEIHGKSNKNPVLLFIHGGPAWPATPMIRSGNQRLFADVTVVSWDQRNCGKSVTDTLVQLSLGLYVRDAHDLTQYLKSRFHTRKIYLACHSWGSVIGLNLIRQFPEDYAGYIGMGQVVDLKRGDSIASAKLRQLAEKAGDSATLRASRAIPFSVAKGYTGGWDDMIRHRNLLVKYRINDHDTVYENQAISRYDDYKSLDWVTPVFRDGKKLYPELIGTDFTGVTEFKVPVWLMVGRFDYNTANPLVETWFKTLSAPAKELFWFENSGHSPQWEEPELFADRAKKIITWGKN
jgi:pimeloyl-ACP methyl ester carboxylesterase